MKRLHITLFALCFAMIFLTGITIGALRFSREKVLGEQELQDYIDKETTKIILMFENEGINVSQSHIIGILWLQCKELKYFIILAKYVYKVDKIYLHWKIDFLRQPVFYIIGNGTAIIYEPF